MTPGRHYSTLDSAKDAEHLIAILSQSFNSSITDCQGYYHRIGQENFRVIRQKGEIAGGLAIYNMGQWFGGQSVPMAGLAAVGIAPEYRGSGLALSLLQETLKELYAKGCPISTLYPATQALYRKAGYEQAGTYCKWDMAIESIQLKDRSLPLRVATSQDRESLKAIYRQAAIQNSGNLDRHPAIWEQILHPSPDEIVYAYLAGPETQAEGYIIFSQHQEGETSRLSIWDWVTLTASATRTFWTLIADHRSQIKTVRWRGSTLDPKLLLLPEQTAKVSGLDCWMLRIVDVKNALEKRGYPLGIVGELHLKISDPLLTENDGTFILTVSEGRGEIQKGGRGDLQVNIRGLAPLYTGLFTPQQLQGAGVLDSTKEALNLASQLFAGPEPWMPDFF